MAAKAQLDQDWVLTRLMAIADVDPADYVSWGPGGAILHASEDLTAEQRRCVEAFVPVGRHMVPRFHDKLKALRALGEHLRLFTPEGATTQNFLVMHSHSKEEGQVIGEDVSEQDQVEGTQPAPPAVIAGLKVHSGED
jgi:hypothetical protein